MAGRDRLAGTGLVHTLTSLAGHHRVRIGAHTVGVVAFASFPMFMALMGFWYGRGTSLSPVLAVVSLLMVPATLSHGGHHLVDLLGAVVLFTALAVGVGRLLPDPEQVRAVSPWGAGSGR